MPVKAATVVYPGNVQEIDDTLGTNELIRRLKQLVDALREIEQEPDEALKYKPLAAHLASEFFMQNPCREVRLLVACCIADILRIFAPDAPYGDPDLLRSVLIFLIKQLRGLANPSDPLFNQCYLLLENLAIVKTLNIVLELEECQDILVIMFKLMFGILNEEGTAEKVQGLMVDVMAYILKDADPVTVRVLDALLINLIEPHKTQNRDCYKCAKDVISISSSSIQPHLETYLLSAISDSKTSESELTEHVFEIIYEVYKIIPQIMTLILSQLEDKIRSSEIKERLETVRLLAKLFSDKDSVVYEECPSLWAVFLSRFQDISNEVRLQCIRSSVDLMVNHEKLRKDLTTALMPRFRDPDENVRAETISMLLVATKRDTNVASAELLDCIKGRTLDKKVKVRKEAVLCLGTIYRKVILNPNSTKENLKLVSWIKNKLLHMYYQQNFDDRILCEKILNTCLVPYFLETEQSMNILYELYCTVDDYATKAFNEIIRQQMSIRLILRSILQCGKQQNENEDCSEIQLKKLKQLSEYFMDPERAFECLKDFYDLLVEDRYALKLMHNVMGENYTTKKIEEAVKELLMKVGPQTKFAHLHSTVRGLLERSAPVMIDKTAIQCLIEKVRLSLQGKRGEFKLDDDVSDEQVVERGLNLLLLFSSAYPFCFWAEESLGTLMTFIRDGHSLAADVVIQIFSKVGRPSESEFANVFACLLPELKKIAQTGTPKQAKYAVRCITKLWPKQDSVLEEILDTVKDEVKLRSVYVQTAFASLSTIAVLRPDEFHAKLKALVPSTVVKNILLSEEDHSNANANEKSWLDETEISQEAKAKVSAIKFLVRRLLGMKSNEDNHATNTLKLLTRIIETNGNVHSVQMNTADKNHLKLTAACGLLKLLQEKLFADLLTLEQFVILSYTITDSCNELRQKFAKKLHSGLRTLKLPLQFMASYALAPLIKTKDTSGVNEFQRQARESISQNYLRRKEFLQKNPSLQGAPAKYLPEYYLSYAIYLLAHYMNYVRHDDSAVLRNLRECIWFAIEPMVNRRDQQRANTQFLYKILQDIKHTSDADDPDNEEQNKKMWSLCDLGMLTITYRVHNFILKGSDQKSLLSKKFFVRPGKSTVTNTTIYIPQELMDEEKRAHSKQKSSRIDQQAPPKSPTSAKNATTMKNAVADELETSTTKVEKTAQKRKGKQTKPTPVAVENKKPKPASVVSPPAAAAAGNTPQRRYALRGLSARSDKSNTDKSGNESENSVADGGSPVTRRTRKRMRIL